MAFDIFVFCVRNGETATFKRELFEEIFSRDEIGRERRPYWNVTYEDGRAYVYGADDDEIEHLMFNHCWGETFFNRLWELADRAGCFIMWPGDAPSIAVTKRSFVEHIFPGVADEFGPPLVIPSGKELEKTL